MNGPRFVVRPIAEADAAGWLNLRRMLWPDQSHADLAADVERFFKEGLPMLLAVLIAEDQGGGLLGMAELSIRPYAEGCLSNNVGFLEGWYVVPHARRQGVGRTLVDASESWARARGCTEFASDTLVDNQLSAEAHRALGFEEVEIIRCFKKSLARHDVT